MPCTAWHSRLAAFCDPCSSAPTFPSTHWRCTSALRPPLTRLCYAVPTSRPTASLTPSKGHLTNFRESEPAHTALRFAALASTLTALGLGGCASTQDIRTGGLEADFKSSKSTQQLTNCIDRNTDGWAWNSLRTSVKALGSEAFEIVVRNGSTTYAVIAIQPGPTGSFAKFRLGGVATATPTSSVQRMTKDCE